MVKRNIFFAFEYFEGWQKTDPCLKGFCFSGFQLVVVFCFLGTHFFVIFWNIFFLSFSFKYFFVFLLEMKSVLLMRYVWPSEKNILRIFFSVSTKSLSELSGKHFTWHKLKMTDLSFTSEKIPYKISNACRDLLWTYFFTKKL